MSHPYRCPKPVKQPSKAYFDGAQASLNFLGTSKQSIKARLVRRRIATKYSKDWQPDFNCYSDRSNCRFELETHPHSVNPTKYSFTSTPACVPIALVIALRSVNSKASSPVPWSPTMSAWMSWPTMPTKRLLCSVCFAAFTRMQSTLPDRVLSLAP